MEEISPVTNNQPTPVSPVIQSTATTQLTEQNVEVTTNNGLKTAVIALFIVFVGRMLIRNTDSINIVAAGVYLGVARHGTHTGKIFLISSTIIYFVLSLLFPSSDPDMAREIFSNLFSALMLSLITFGIGALIRKFRKNK